MSAQQNDFPTLGSVGGWRTFLAVPLRQQGELIGVLIARRIEVRPFTPAQIKLLETFADQAVIAIENVRLFHELKESLEQQTATSEILGVIASSPTDIQPVLDAVAQSAARLCDARDAVIYRVDGDVLRASGTFVDRYRFGQLRAADSLAARRPGRAVVDRQTIHIHDIDGRIRNRVSGYRRAGTAARSRARTMTRHAAAARRYCRLERFSFAARKSVLLPTNRSRFLKPSPTKP